MAIIFRCDNCGKEEIFVGQYGEIKNEYIETLLLLDSDNPEHIAAYAEAQGGISVNLARKMLIMHQEGMRKKEMKEDKEENR